MTEDDLNVFQMGEAIADMLTWAGLESLDGDTGETLVHARKAETPTSPLPEEYTIGEGTCKPGDLCRVYNRDLDGRWVSGKLVVLNNFHSPTQNVNWVSQDPAGYYITSASLAWYHFELAAPRVDTWSPRGNGDLILDESVALWDAVFKEGGQARPAHPLDERLNEAVSSTGTRHLFHPQQQSSLCGQDARKLSKVGVCENLEGICARCRSRLKKAAMFGLNPEDESTWLFDRNIRRSALIDSYPEYQKNF